MLNRVLEHFSAGDLDEDALLQELYRQMFIVTYSILRDKYEAMDAVQESWIKILQKIDTLRDNDKLIRWAKVIASNTAFNLLKRKIAATHQSAQDDGKEPLSRDGVEDVVLCNMIFELIRQLDEKTRQILIYKFYYDMKDKEIAQKMSLPVGTVKARIHRGKERLRALLTSER